MTGIRVANRVLAAVVALALLAASLLVAAEIVVAALDRPPWVLPVDSWYRTARGDAWESGAVRLACAGLAACGALLLASQLIRRRPDELTLPDRPDTAPATVTRRGVERSVEQAVASVDGVSRASARLGRHGVAVSVETNRRRPGDLQERVQEAGEARLGSLGLAGGISLDARVRSREQR